MEDLHMILGYCTGRSIPVVFGDWGGGFVDVAAKTVDENRMEQSAKLVRYLLEDCGYTCIRYFNMVNEPNGSWSSTQGDCDLWVRAARAMHASLRRCGLGDRVTLVGPDAAVWTTAETHWVSRTADELGDAVGLYDIHTYPSKAEINAGEYGEMIAAYRVAAPAERRMIVGEIGIKFIDERDAAYAAENERRAARCPYASPADSQMSVFDHMYGTDMADAIMQTAANGYSGCIVWMLDDAMHVNEPGRLKIWGFWNILGEERYGASAERIRPWYYAVALLSRYFPAGSQILESTVRGVPGVRTMWGRSDGKPTLAIVNTNRDRAVELTLEGADSSLAGLDRYLYAEGGLKLDEERLLPVDERIALRSGRPDPHRSRVDGRLYGVGVVLSAGRRGASSRRRAGTAQRPRRPAARPARRRVRVRGSAMRRAGRSAPALCAACGGRFSCRRTRVRRAPRPPYRPWPRGSAPCPARRGR